MFELETVVGSSYRSVYAGAGSVFSNPFPDDIDAYSRYLDGSHEFLGKDVLLGLRRHRLLASLWRVYGANISSESLEELQALRSMLCGSTEARPSSSYHLPCVNNQENGLADIDDGILKSVYLCLAALTATNMPATDFGFTEPDSLVLSKVKIFSVQVVRALTSMLANGTVFSLGKRSRRQHANRVLPTFGICFVNSHDGRSNTIHGRAVASIAAGGLDGMTIVYDPLKSNRWVSEATFSKQRSSDAPLCSYDVVGMIPFPL